jgi:formamidopyrimidine-DNA glycosylase
MPELPDILAYVDGLRRTVVGNRLLTLRIVSPFVLRTYEVPSDAVDEQKLQSIDRIGKRLVFEFDRETFVVVHLMIAGRWKWSSKVREKTPAKIGLTSFCFENGTLHLIEPAQHKRASIHIGKTREWLRQFDRGGANVLDISLDEFTLRIRRENHTIKRTLTDPRLFDGIGNAYSDEILHAAHLSPLKLTSRLAIDEIDRLYHAARRTLREWTQRLVAEFASHFPKPSEITAFRPDFAVHGRFNQPCPVCQTRVRRIRYAENETNYCPRCQTEGKVLADRSLSRLLKSDFPRTIEELEG